MKLINNRGNILFNECSGGERLQPARGAEATG